MKHSMHLGREWIHHPPAGLASCASLSGNFPELVPEESARSLLAFFCVTGTKVIPAGAVATGVECDAFRHWIDGLKEEGNEALVQIRQWGFTYDLPALQVQLRRALEANPPDGLVSRGVGRRLLDLLARLQGAACFLLEEKLPPAEPLPVTASATTSAVR